MKKCYWLIILFCLQLAISCNAMAFNFGTDVIIQTGNEYYNMSTALPFSSMLVDPKPSFNNTRMHITSSNNINISIIYLNDDIAGATDDETILQFGANTTSGTVTFSISGFVATTDYNIERGGTEITTATANSTGHISFTNSVWSEYEFEVIADVPAAAASPSSTGLNGSDLINNPMNIIFSPWTDMFENVTGYGAAFWLFILVVMTFAVYIKTQKPEVAMLFMIGSGAFFSTSTAFTGAGDITMAFLIFTAIGLTSLFIKLIYFRGE